MQQWEYLTWIVAYTSTSLGASKWEGGVIEFLNGKKVPDWKEGPKLYEALNQAGAEGWELVNTYHQDGTAPTFIFKRPARQ